jgi:hypothetical protein
MEAMRSVLELKKDRKITVVVPESFSSEMVEIIVLPYEKEKASQTKKESLVDFFQSSPLHGFDIDVERNQDFGREIHL